jgi:hypothetical protein
MVKLQEAENQIVTDYEVYDQRPSDSDLLIGAVEIHQARLGRTPRLVAADAAFYSAKNETAAKAKGVKRFCVPNRSTKRGAQTRTEEALVPQRPEMADRMRGTHQRRQAPTRAQPLPLQGRGRNGALGRTRHRRRQSPQHRSCIGKAVRSVDRPLAFSGTHHNIPPATPGGIRFTAQPLTALQKNINFAPESS